MASKGEGGAMGALALDMGRARAGQGAQRGETEGGAAEECNHSLDRSQSRQSSGRGPALGDRAQRDDGGHHRTGWEMRHMQEDGGGKLLWRKKVACSRSASRLCVLFRQLDDLKRLEHQALAYALGHVRQPLAPAADPLQSHPTELANPQSPSVAVGILVAHRKRGRHPNPEAERGLVAADSSRRCAARMTPELQLI